jgi:hypothetical protein
LTLQILELVWEVYGKYGAKFLERLTHLEDPWRLARKGLNEDNSSNTEIKDKDILDYYSSIKEKYNIDNANDLDKYISSVCFI